MTPAAGEGDPEETEAPGRFPQSVESFGFMRNVRRQRGVGDTHHVGTVDQDEGNHRHDVPYDQVELGVHLEWLVLQ